MPRVLITGAGGFIGRHVVRACLGRGWEVVGLDRNEPPGPPPVGYTHILHDSTPGDPIPDGSGALHCDVAILLAWPVDPSTYLTSISNVDALACTTAVANALLSAGCKRIVAAGSCAEYAGSSVHPMCEDHTVSPTCLYAACKVSAHLAIEELCRKTGGALAWARIFNTYGPGEPPARLIPTIVRKMAARVVFEAGSGSEIRDYVHIEDVASALSLLAGQAPDTRGVFNIATGVGIGLGDLMLLVAKNCNNPPDMIALGRKPDRPWDPKCLIGDPQRLVGLGWSPRSLHQGLSMYVSSLMEVR